MSKESNNIRFYFFEDAIWWEEKINTAHRL